MTSGKRRSPVVYLVALGLALEARSLGAIDCSVAKPGFPPSNASLFTLSAPGLTTSELQTAISYWACPSYLDEVPTMQIGGSGGVPVNIVKVNGNSPGTCGEAEPQVQNGEVSSATITVWTHDSSGGSCAPLYDVVAHELGHVMGLDNAPDPYGQCFGHIMGGRLDGGTRSVGSDDCAIADQMWHTTYEDAPNDPIARPMAARRFCSMWRTTGSI